MITNSLTSSRWASLLLAALLAVSLAAPGGQARAQDAVVSPVPATPTPPPAGQRVAQEPTAAPAPTPTFVRGFGRRPRPTPPPLPLWIALGGVAGVALTLALVFWGRRARR